MLGTQKNPYNYIKNCDLYVQPSYTEGYSTTICEAGILGKPIIGTKSSGGIYEQISDGQDGLIVDPEAKSIADSILMLIRDKEMRTQLGRSVRKKDFEGKNEISKFLSYLAE